MDVSVLIPTRGRAGKVAACVRSLLGQAFEGRFEVLVGIDGEDQPQRGEAERAIEGVVRECEGGATARVEVAALSKRGQAGVRNSLLEVARGEVLVFLNDDVVADAGLVSAHVAAQREAALAGEPPVAQGESVGAGARPARGLAGRGTPGVGALVVGEAAWRRWADGTLFDRLVRETSMVFFYDRMLGDRDRWRDWGFRHAWLINLSAPAALVHEAGGFSEFEATYGYEDDELAFRLAERFGTPVLFRPEARVEHDHRLTPREYLRRERALGFAAWGFARARPECAAAMFGRDVASAEEVAYAREAVSRERRDVARLTPAFERLAEVPEDAVGGAHAGALIEALYGQHLAIKRWHWRIGFLCAAEGRGIGEISEVVQG